jgi:phage terminase large subunit-like protein
MRGEWRELLEQLEPEDSVAAYLCRRAGSVEGVRALFDDLSDDEVAALAYDLDFWARRQQVPPATAWTWCVMLAGRGFGKTFAGARWAIAKAREGKAAGALIGPTAADVRDTMIKGSSGILALSPPDFMPVYEPSKRRLTWPNGVFAVAYSADKPDRLRGPNTGWVWGDEPASWRYEMAALDQIPLFNRLGTREAPPQTLLTGTPRPIRKLAELLERPDTVRITGSSLANAANLAPSAVAAMRAMSETRWGQQEVLGQLLMDVPGSLFGSARWGRVEADPLEYAKTLDRRIVSVDPAPTSDVGADETGIIVQGSRVGEDRLKRVSILKDASLKASPREWASTAIHEYLAFGADALVVELNSGGEMVTTLVETVAREMGVVVNVRPVRAKEHKSKRAEPVSALAETGRIEFVGEHTKLERQLASFTGRPDRRDDRVDAMNWGVHELVFSEQFFAVF